MAVSTFDQLYKKLNTEQRQAVDAIEGPVMVVAGPGTGKTQVLTLRIANILRKTDIPADAVLALTFTESAAAICRRRLVDIVGTSGYRVQIHTFHGYANEVIRRFPDSFPRIVGSRPLSSVERIAILQELVDAESIEVLRPFGNAYFYVPSVAQKISELKRENISPRDFAKLLQKQKKEFESISDLYYTSEARKGLMKGKYTQTARRLKRDGDLLRIYKAYETALAEKHVYDYEDMLLEVIRTLAIDSDLLLTLQEECQYVLADEHQDANESQNRLLELLVSFHATPNLFVVGDEKQAIFRFQGASIDNFSHFKKKYSKAVLVTLRKNYRSTQPILDAAHSLIAGSPLSSQFSDKAEKIQVFSLPRPRDEYAYVAKDIARRIAEGLEPRDIAVLFRVNRDVRGMAEALSSYGCPYIIESEHNALTDLFVQKFIALLAAIDNYGKEEVLVPVLHINFIEISPLDAAKFLSLKRENLFEALSNTALLRKIGIKDTKQFVALGKKLERWKKVSHNDTLLATLEAVAEESGLIASLLQTAFPEEQLATLTALFREAEVISTADRKITLRNFLQHLYLLEEYRLPLSVSYNFGDRQGVRLMTAHRAKGQEFNEVYIIHANDGQWGNRSGPNFFVSLGETETESDIEEERRLFYVALTRARRQVVITYARERESGAPVLPSQFIEEINIDLITRHNLNEEAPLIHSPRLTTGERITRSFVQNLFEQQGLSVTALNNYLECPWRYFYRNLLRIPEAPEKELEYGTAIHTALRDFFEIWKEGSNPGVKGLLLRFRRALTLTTLPERVYVEMLSKGERALTAYYKQKHKVWNRSIVNEYSLTALIPIDLPGLTHLRLRGDIDKLSFEHGISIVYDYKTGKRKTRGQIVGGIEPRTWGNYKRQLVFYKLLLDLHANSMRSHRFPEAQSGTVEFIEPDERGKCASEEILLTSDETKQLQKLLSQVAKEIWSLAFVSGGCKKINCRYCMLRQFIIPSLDPTSVAHSSSQPMRRKRGVARQRRR